MKLQACIGPGKLGVMHLRDALSTSVQNGDLVLCQSTTAFFDYHGDLSADKLCRKCMRLFYDAKPVWKGERITAEVIGVRSIRHA
jgi:hypothetical protein